MHQLKSDTEIAERSYELGRSYAKRGVDKAEYLNNQQCTIRKISFTAGYNSRINETLMAQLLEGEEIILGGDHAIRSYA